MNERIRLCGICGKEFDYKYSPDGKMVNSNHRRSCYECVPFGTRPETNYSKGINKRYGSRYKYNFSDIQSDYDNGFTYRELTKKYGICSNSISQAVRRGDLLTRTLSEASKLSVSLGRFGNRVMSEDARNKLSERQSVHNSGGRTKWFSVNGVKVQGTWERNVAISLDGMGVKWVRPKSDMTLRYMDDLGKEHRYTPDFYLPEYNRYLEVKGFWWGNDKHKMELVVSQNPNKNIVIINKELYEKLIYGERVW